MNGDFAILFAYYFPPQNAIGALRPFRFYKYLSRLGYRCHVITAVNTASMPEISATHIPDPFEETPRNGMGWQVERAIRRFAFPGIAGSQWSVLAYRAAMQILKTNAAERTTIFSTSPPLGAHAAAYWLSRKTKLPWIADCRDPVADNPALDHINTYTKHLYRKLEGIFVGAADYTIANTDAAQQRLQRRYQRFADRIELIWNGFDPEKRLTPFPAADGRKVVAHVGELYGGRTMVPILESLRRLISGGRLDPDGFEVRLVGPAVHNSIPDAGFTGQAVREGWLRLEPERIPQRDAQTVIRKADALLLIQPQSALQVPGKLFEYIQIGRPILAFVPPASPVERILEKSGVPFRCAYPGGSQETFDRSILEFFRLDRAETRPSEWFERNFNAQSQSDKLAGMMSSLHRKQEARAVKEAVSSEIV